MEYSVMKKIILFVCALCLWSCEELGLTMDYPEEIRLDVSVLNSSDRQIYVGHYLTDNQMHDSPRLPSREHCSKDYGIKPSWRYSFSFMGYSSWEDFYKEYNAINVAIFSSYDNFERWILGQDTADLDTLIKYTIDNIPDKNSYTVEFVFGE